MPHPDTAPYSMLPLCSPHCRQQDLRGLVLVVEIAIAPMIIHSGTKFPWNVKVTTQPYG